MLQRNTSGHTLAVMTSPPCEIGPGGEIEHDTPITGFEVVDDTVEPSVSHEAPDPSAGELPAAPVEPVAAAPVEPAPVVPAPAAPVEPTPVVAEPESVAPEPQQVPTWPPAQPPAPGSVVST